MYLPITAFVSFPWLQSVATMEFERTVPLSMHLLFVGCWNCEDNLVQDMAISSNPKDVEINRVTYVIPKTPLLWFCWLIGFCFLVATHHCPHLFTISQIQKQIPSAKPQLQPHQRKHRYNTHTKDNNNEQSNLQFLPINVATAAFFTVFCPHCVRGIFKNLLEKSKTISGRK